jgi:hypothetical protein
MSEVLEQVRAWMQEDAEMRHLVTELVVDSTRFAVWLWESEDTFKPGEGDTLDEALAAALAAKPKSLKVTKDEREARERMERLAKLKPFNITDVERIPECEAFAKWLHAEALAGSEADIRREASLYAQSVHSVVPNAEKYELAHNRKGTQEDYRPNYRAYLAREVRLRLERYWRVITLRIVMDLEEETDERNQSSDQVPEGPAQPG